MEKIRDGESQKREDAGARKGREVAKQVFHVVCVKASVWKLLCGNCVIGSVSLRLKQRNDQPNRNESEAHICKGGMCSDA